MGNRYTITIAAIVLMMLTVLYQVRRGHGGDGSLTPRLAGAENPLAAVGTSSSADRQTQGDAALQPNDLKSADAPAPINEQPVQATASDVKPSESSEESDDEDVQEEPVRKAPKKKALAPKSLVAAPKAKAAKQMEPVIALKPLPKAKDERIGLLVEGGYNFGWSMVDPPMSSCCRDGLLIGVAVELPLSDGLSFLPGLRYVQKGGYTVIAGTPVNVALDYIEIPLQVKATASTGRLRPFLVFGPSIGFNVNAVGSARTVFQDLSFKTSAIDISIEAGIGAEFDMGDDSSVYLLNRYSMGLIDADTTSDSWFNRSNQIVIGFKYLFK